MIEVHKAWAPKGAQRFYELVQATSYYRREPLFPHRAEFHRAIRHGGRSGDGKQWDKNITDDPVTQTNRPGSVTFATAGPNTRTTQLFINLGSNQMLDARVSRPSAWWWKA